MSLKKHLISIILIIAATTACQQQLPLKPASEATNYTESKFTQVNPAPVATHHTAGKAVDNATQTALGVDVSSSPVAAFNTASKAVGDRTQTSLGIDVSHFQNAVNWDEIKRAGITYAYAKATQGIDYIDPRYKQNRAGTAAAGLYHGPYHFYMPYDDPDRQAELFINTVNKLDARTMPPVLDLEQGGLEPGAQLERYQHNILTWLKKVEKAFGVKPIIYTNHPFGNQYLNHPDFAYYDLWIAEYGVPAPRIPEPWKEKGWIMWQRTESGKTEGAIGYVDHDILKGTPNYSRYR
jgi:lysozyme